MKRIKASNINKYGYEQVIVILDFITNPKRNVYAEKDVSRPGVLVGAIKKEFSKPYQPCEKEKIKKKIIENKDPMKVLELLDELEDAKESLPQFKREKYGAYRPIRWADTSPKLKVYMNALALTEKRFEQLNLNFSDDVILAARNSKYGFAGYIQRRMNSALKKEFGEVPDFWFCIEAKKKKMGRLRVNPNWSYEEHVRRANAHSRKMVRSISRPERLHLHGAIEIPLKYYPDYQNVRRRLRTALLQVAGKDYDRSELGNAVVLKKPNNLAKWAGKYVVKFINETEKEIDGNSFAKTRSLNAQATNLYEEIRGLIIERGIKGWTLQRSNLKKYFRR